MLRARRGCTEVVPGSPVLSSLLRVIGLSGQLEVAVLGIRLVEVGSPLSAACFEGLMHRRVWTRNGSWAFVHSDRQGLTRPHFRVVGQQNSWVYLVSHDPCRVGWWLGHGQWYPGIDLHRLESKSRYPEREDEEDYDGQCAGLKTADASHSEFLDAR